MTLDDGPDVDATPAVLDALDEAGARATFFVIAGQVRRNLALANEIHRRGHEIALHGYEHCRHDRLTAAHSRDDVMQGFAAIEEATGVRCRWYRPPFGRMTLAAASACQELEMTLVYWSAWGVDWESVPRTESPSSRRRSLTTARFSYFTTRPDTRTAQARCQRPGRFP